jgi:hypothetical protein
MGRDQSSENPASLVELDEGNSISSRGNVTRREVLIGGASTVVAGQVLAAERTPPYLDVYYTDATRQGLAVAWVDTQRYEWRLASPSLTADGAGRFVLRKTQKGWSASLPRCSFPGGYQFDLLIDVAWEADKPLIASLTFSMTTGGKTLALAPKDLIAFLKVDGQRDGSGKDEIAGPIDKPRLTVFAKSLFGETFEHGNAQKAVLAFHHDGYWILRGHKPAKGEAGPPDNWFSALSTEGLKLRFREIAFGIFTSSIGTAGAFQISSGTDRAKEDVRALFSGDSAPPPVPQDGKTLPRVLYGLVRHNDSPQLVAAGNDMWLGTLAFGSAPAGETAQLELMDQASPSYLAWRNAGDGNPVVALQGPGSLIVRRAASAPETRFEKTSARVWHVVNQGTLRVVASLTPQVPGMRLNTIFGPLVVTPLPSLAPKPGTNARVPPIQVGGKGPKANRSISHFVAPLALESAAINLSSSRLARELDDAAPLSSDAQKALRNESYLLSELSFSEAECLFRIKDVGLRFSWLGPAAPSADPPQAEAIIHIGTIAGVDLPARIALNRATLRVRRPADLLALTYRFQDLVLERSNGGWFVKPDRRLAAFRPSGVPLPEPTAPLICDDIPAAPDDPARYQRRADPRPLLAVDFPPQHIAEQAFFRRLQPDPKLPIPPAEGEPTLEQADKLRFGTLTDRLTVRNVIKDNLGMLPKEAGWDDFVVEFEKTFDKSGKTIPADQRIYIGPGYLDIETARIARAAKRKLEAGGTATGSAADERARRLRDAPEVDLSPTVVKQLRDTNNIAAGISEDYPASTSTSPAPTPTAGIIKWLRERHETKSRADATYGEFSKFYGLPLSERIKPAGLTQDQLTDINGYPTLPGPFDPFTTTPVPFYGRRNILARLALLSDADALKAAKAIAATVVAFDLKLEAEEPLKIPAEARVSGGSRLVFRIPADDFEGGRPDNLDGAPAGAFPFTIEALTNWGAFDLAVVRRAEKVFEPMPGWTSNDPKLPWPARPYGRLPPRWARQETRDEAAKLLHQGISRGDAWARRHDEQRETGESSCPLPLARLGSVTAPQRMAEVVANVREPGLYETSIEIPFRLMLSPAQDASWQAPLELPSDLKLAQSARTIAPLWFARLDETPGASSLRAVWSPDFRPDALLDAELGGPPHGPWAPWAMARDVTARHPYESEESIYPGGTGAPTRKPERFRTGLDVTDRHELVALSSLYGLPVRGRRKPEGTLTDGSQIDPPPGFKLRHAGIESLDPNGAPPKADYSAIYRPQAIGVAELTLSAIGGSFDADTNFVPPASAKIIPTKVWDPTNPDNADIKNGAPLFDALSVERWRQQTRLGRDIRAEVVYKGFLFPFGHRCSLVKLTERRFVAAPTATGQPLGGPIAYLIQRMFLRIGTPVKTFPAIGQANGGRGWPMKQLEILTRVTPDILDPTDSTYSSGGPPEDARGRIFLPDPDNNNTLLPGLVFWPRVRARKGGEINFEVQIDGRGSRTRIPLIFVDFTAANDKRTMKALKDYYNTRTEQTSGPDTRRILQLGGDKRRYAEEKEPDGTSFETYSWLLEAEGREGGIPDFNDDVRNMKFDNTNFDFGSLLQGVDQPPFYPFMKQGRVHIAQIDRMIGTLSPPVDVTIDDEYRAFGFPQSLDYKPGTAKDRRAKADVYLDFVTEVALDPGRNGERTGGPLRPNTPLVAMSRSQGPVGNNNSAQKVAGAKSLTGLPSRAFGLDQSDAASFFGDARLLGIVDLKVALGFIGSGIAKTPQFKEITQYTSALIAQAKDDDAAAVAMVRDQLLVPLRSALLTLAQQFYLSNAVPQGGQLPSDFETAALTRLEMLYPDVGSAYRDLRDTLDAAIEFSQTAKDVGELTAYFAAVYAAGMRFVSAIERVANDPIAPVREALREAFNKDIAQLIIAVQEQIALTSNLLKQVPDKLKAIADGVSKDFGKLLTLAVFGTWRHLVLSLPGAFSLPQRLAAQATYVEDTVDQCLGSVTGFVETLVKQGVAPAIQKLATDFDALFSAAILAAATSDQKEALQIAYRDWNAAADTVEKRIAGLLLDNGPMQPVENTRRLLKAAAALVSQTGQPTMGGVAGALLEFVNAIGANVALPPDLANAAAFCGSMTAPFVTYLGEVLPTTGSPLFPKFDTLKTDSQIESKFDAAAAAIEVIDHSLAVEVTSIKAFLVAEIDQLIEARNVLQRNIVQLATLSNQVCTTAPDRLMLDALAGVRRARRVFLQQLNQFQISFASPALPDVGGRLLTVMGKLAGTTTPLKTARAALVAAAQSAIGVEAALSQVAYDATSLRQLATGNALVATRATLITIRNSIADPNSTAYQRLTLIVGVIDTINQAGSDPRKRQQDIHDAVTKLAAQAIAAVADQQELQFLTDARSLATLAANTVQLIVEQVIDAAEQQIAAGMVEFLLAAQPYLDKILAIGPKALAAVFGILSPAQDFLLTNRRIIWDTLGCTAGQALALNTDPFGGDLSGAVLQKICSLLLVA